MAKHEGSRLPHEAGVVGLKQLEVAQLLKKKQIHEDDDKAASSTQEEQVVAQDATIELAAAEGTFASDASPMMVAAAQSDNSNTGGGAMTGGGSTGGAGGLSTGAWVGIGLAAVGGGLLIAEATDDDDGGNAADGDVDSVTPDATSVNEGGSIQYTITGTPGTTVAYQITGVQAADISGPLSGSVTLDDNGTAVLTVTTLVDDVGENNESIVLTVGGVAAPGVSIVDPAIAAELDLTPDQDTILLGDTDGVTIIRGVVDPAELGQNDESTFTNGDIIEGNGQTVVRLFVDSAATTQPADVVRMTDVAVVELFAQTAGTIVFPAVSWDGVGEIAYVGGIGGMGVLATSLDAGVDMRVAENVAGGFVGASYTTNLFAIAGGSGKGGASISFGDDNIADLTVNVAQPLNTGFMFAGGVLPGDVVVGDMTGTAVDSATLTASGSATGDLTVGDVSLSLGDSGLAYITFSATGDLLLGDIGVAMGDVGSASINFTSSSADVTVGDVNVALGNTSTVSMDFFVFSGDLTLGDVTVVGGDNNSASLSMTAGLAASVTGNITAGNIDISIGDYTGTGTNYVWVGAYAAEDITVGDVLVSIGDYTASGTGSATISMTAGIATTTGVGGNLTVGNISLVAGDNYDVSVTLDFAGSGTDMVVGDVTVGVGDRLSTTTGNTTPFAYVGLFNTSALAGGDLTVGNVALSAGVSASFSMDVSLTGNAGTTQTGDLGNLTVGNISMVLGENGVGDVEIYQFQTATTTNQQGMGSFTVGDMTATLGLDASLSISLSQQLEGTVATAPSMGDYTVGNLTANLDIGADLYYFVYGYNNAAVATPTTPNFNVGNVTIGDVAIVADDGAYVSITYSFSATSGSIESVSIGDFDVTMGVASTFTLDVSFSANSIGDVTIGDWSFVLGQSASGDFSNSVNFSATTGDIGNVVIGDVSMVLGQSAFWSDFAWYFDAVGDIASFSMGDFNLDIGQSAAYTSYAYVTVTADGNIGAVNFGDLTVDVDVGGSISETIDRNVYGDDVGQVTFGNVSLAGHGMASTLSLSLSVTATDELAGFTLGDVSLISDTSNSWMIDVDVNLSGSTIGDINVGTVLFDYTTAATGALSFSLNQSAATTSGDITVAGLVLDFTALGTTAAAAVDYYFFGVFAGSGDVHIDLIDVNVTLSSTNTAAAATEATLLNLSNILASVTTTGTFSLGTVDYSDYVYAGTLVNPTVTIDVSPYAGDITVIGSVQVDNIIANTTGANTLTGGGGGDFFNLGVGNDALALADVHTIVDFVTAVDQVTIDVTTAATVGEYAELSTASTSFADFLADATVRANDPGEEDYLIAGTITGQAGVFVAVDENQDGTIDFIFQIENATLGTLNFADFSEV